TGYAGGGAARHRRDPCRGRAHHLRGSGLPQAGAVDGPAPGPAPGGDGRRRRGVRFPRGSQAAGTALDAGGGTGVGVQAGERASPALAPLSVSQSAVRGRVRAPAPRRSPPPHRRRSESLTSPTPSRRDSMKKTALVTGAGGFIGHHLV